MKHFMYSLVLSAAFLQACAVPVPAPEPGMRVIDYDRGSEFQVAFDADWTRYSKVRIEPATVEFLENWIRDQDVYSDNIIRERDEVRIKTGMSELLGEVLSRDLAKGGYEMTGESSQEAMLFVPRIVDLNIVAPDRVRDTISHTMTDSQGSMTLELEIRDSVSGELLATTRYFSEDPYKGYMERTTSTTNRLAFRLMMERWADWLIEHLDSVRATSSG